MRNSYTYICTNCHSMYSWVPETDAEKPKKCGIRVGKTEADPEGSPCPGHGEKVL